MCRDGESLVHRHPSALMSLQGQKAHTGRFFQGQAMFIFSSISGGCLKSKLGSAETGWGAPDPPELRQVSRTIWRFPVMGGGEVTSEEHPHPHKRRGQLLAQRAGHSLKEGQVKTFQLSLCLCLSICLLPSSLSTSVTLKRQRREGNRCPWPPSLPWTP